MPLRRSNHAQGTTMTSTDDLIHSLASTAGTRRGRVSLEAALAVTGAASLPCAFKVVYAGALVVGASVVALYAATPGAPATALYAFSPAVILLACGVIFDPTGFPIMGRTDAAVAICVGRILFLSLPAMILTFAFMRRAAPTQPLFAGAVIGILSASVG